MKEFNDEQKPSLGILAKHYFCSLLVYLFIIIIINISPLMHERLSDQIVSWFNIAYVLYMLIAPICLFITRPKSVYHSHNIIIVEYFRRLLSIEIRPVRSNIEDIKDFVSRYLPNYEEGQALMLMFIKVFFGTLMISGLVNDINILHERFGEYRNLFVSAYHDLLSGSFHKFVELINFNKNFIYINLVLLLFSIDLFCFVIGYFTELDILKNRIKYVETTPLGIFFCLACYPPFNNATASFIGWSQSDEAMAFNSVDHPLTWVFRLTALFFLVIYVSASVALGTKASNLTNRGTVSCFPYNIVRHPAYISKNMFWLLTTLPMFFGNFDLIHFLAVILAWAVWASIYYFRAITEERLMSKDPQYLEYKEKVKYGFIPGIF